MIKKIKRYDAESLGGGHDARLFVRQKQHMFCRRGRGRKEREEKEEQDKVEDGNEEDKKEDQEQEDGKRGKGGWHEEERKVAEEDPAIPTSPVLKY